MDTNLLTIFLTGLFTGGLTCMAVQGGLLAATIAQREQEKLEEKARHGHALPIIAFLTAKLIAYTVLGFLLGSLGSFFKLSLSTQVVLQFAVAIFMVGSAFNMLNIHPVFRYFVVQPPKFLTRLVRKQSKSQDLFAPAVLGGFTVFIPCGTTQAMMALAIASGNPILGASILFAFVLGTSPLFFVLGYFTTKLGDRLHQNFMKIAAYAIILLAIFNINNSIALTGSTLTIGNLWKEIYCTTTFCDNPLEGNQVQAAVSDPVIEITAYGYSPSYLTVKKGDDINLQVKNIDGQGCQQAFTIPFLGLQKVIPPGASETITFKAPGSPTQILFMCSMGMFQGTIEVI